MDARTAEVVARTAFCDQWDKLDHTTQVVERLGKDATEEEQAVAWLHDVIEDTDVQLVDLIDLGFSEDVVNAVKALSRVKGSPYEEYAVALLVAPGEWGRIARKVKLADARVNLKRCETTTVPKWKRLAETRYRPMVVALEEMEKKPPPARLFDS